MAWTKLGVVIPLGGVGDFDEVHTRGPAPILLDGRVLLYYGGQEGTTYRIGLAGSDDGIHFTKLGVVIPLGGVGDFDVSDADTPAPLLLDGRVLLYYTGHNGPAWRIGLAASDDGIHFTKLGVVIPLGGAGEFDDVRAYGAAPLLLDGRVLLYYTGYDGADHRVGLAVSDDGVHFTKLGVVVPLGAAGDFDDEQTGASGPLALDGRVLLYYAGHDGAVYRVGVAGSNDGTHFTKLGVILPLGGVGDFDEFRVWTPAPLLLDGRVLVYYAGRDGTTYRVGLAASDEGI